MELKYILSITAAIAIITSQTAIMPSCALAAETAEIAESGIPYGEFNYSVLSGSTAEITGYTGKDSIVNIPWEINGYPVTYIGWEAFKGCDIYGANIPEGVTAVGKWAFFNCTSLKSVNIPSTVYSISGYAFGGCSKLKSVTLPESVRSIGESSFAGCTSLEKVVIPDSVTSIKEWAFYNCPNLTIFGYPGSAAEKYANENGVAFAALEKVVSGDVDGDNMATSSDALMILRESVSLESFDQRQITRADLNNDGVIDSFDALSVLRTSVGIN